MKISDSDSIISRYKKYLQAEKMVAPGTIQLYMETIKHFIQYCIRCENELALPTQWGMEQIGVREIESFLHSSMVARYKHETLVTQLSAIRSFFKYLHEGGILQKNPVQHYTLQRGFKEMKLMSMSHSAMEKYFMRIPKDGLGWRRNRLLLELSYGMGMTTRQLAEISDITATKDGNTISIQDLDGNKKISPFGVQGLEALRNYISELKKHAFMNRKDKKGFWLDESGKEMSANKIRRQITKTLKSIGLGELKQGMLRELSSQHFAEDGADIRSVQNLRNVKGLKRIRPLYRRKFDELQNAFRVSHNRNTKSELMGK